MASMTPEEYAARELNVAGYDSEEITYVPGNDTHITEVFNNGTPEPSQSPLLDPELQAMSREWNFDLPLEIRRAELLTETKKHAHLDARTNFWNTLALTVVLTPILAFIAVLVK